LPVLGASHQFPINSRPNRALPLDHDGPATSSRNYYACLFFLSKNGVSKNGEHGSHLGTVRWVVERTISWIKGLRRMRIRFDRSGTIVNAFATLAAAMICFQMAQAA
jgi:hypothetical protein